MKKQISRISLVQNAKLMAAIYLVITAPLLLIFALICIAAGKALAVPLILIGAALYVAGGFVGTVIAAWIYNLVAARVGGFEYTTAEVKPA